MNGGLPPQKYRVTFCDPGLLSENCAEPADYDPGALPAVPATGVTRVYVAAIVDGHVDGNPPTATVNPAPAPQPDPPTDPEPDPPQPEDPAG